jgi:hypothetical protein
MWKTNTEEGGNKTNHYLTIPPIEQQKCFAIYDLWRTLEKYEPRAQ